MTRRQLLGAALAAPAFGQAPAVVGSARAKPVIRAIQSGDPVAGRAIVWARADRPSRMLLEWATTESFRNVSRLRGPFAIESSDFTARVDLPGLPAGQNIFYQVRFESLADGKTLSEPLRGQLRTAPAGLRDLRVLWSGDTCGQGWGIDPARGGMKIYETMRRRQPDLFLHSGDTIYADNPLAPEVKLPDGSMWRNIVTEEKSKVAETLDEFRGNYRYNFLDDHYRRFSEEVTQVWQWDDHEVMNNWSPGLKLESNERYREKSAPLLVARATRAFLDYAPLRFCADESDRVYRLIPYGPLMDLFVLDMRSYRGPNTHNRQTEPGGETAYLGDAQVRWLKTALLESRALWKIIVADMPLGLIVGDGKDEQGRDRFENNANGDGPPLGRELEIAAVLRFLKEQNIRNTVWVTADTHYTAAHYYDPGKARFTEFLPFWEFVSGPLHAGTFGPNALDNTFGIQVMFQKAPPPGRANLSPAEGYQFFGELFVDARSTELTVSLCDASGATLYKKNLSPEL